MSSNFEIPYEAWPEGAYDIGLIIDCLGEIGSVVSVGDPDAELRIANTVISSFANLYAAHQQGFINGISAEISVGGYRCPVHIPDKE